MKEKVQNIASLKLYLHWNIKEKREESMLACQTFRTLPLVDIRPEPGPIRDILSIRKKLPRSSKTQMPIGRSDLSYNRTIFILHPALSICQEAR